MEALRRAGVNDAVARDVDARGRELWTRRVFANVWQIFARFRLYRRRSLQENTRFAAFFKIYQII